MKTSSATLAGRENLIIKKKGREKEPSSKFILVTTNLVHGMQ